MIAMRLPSSLPAISTPLGILLVGIPVRRRDVTLARREAW
jgi:hypothetical protein